MFVSMFSGMYRIHTTILHMYRHILHSISAILQFCGNWHGVRHNANAQHKLKQKKTGENCKKLNFVSCGVRYHNSQSQPSDILYPLNNSVLLFLLQRYRTRFSFFLFIFNLVCRCTKLWSNERCSVFAIIVFSCTSFSRKTIPSQNASVVALAYVRCYLYALPKRYADG